MMTTAIVEFCMSNEEQMKMFAEFIESYKGSLGGIWYDTVAEEE